MSPRSVIGLRGDHWGFTASFQQNIEFLEVLLQHAAVGRSVESGRRMEDREQRQRDSTQLYLFDLSVHRSDATFRFSQQLCREVARVQTTRGETMRICSMRNRLQDKISSASGSLFLGGRHFTTLAIYTILRSRPIDPRSSSNSFPARPTKGSPC